MPSDAEIITMAAIRLDANYNVVSARDWKIRPRIWRNEYESSVKIHGIDREQSLVFDRFESVFYDICSYLFEVDNQVFVCHANRIRNITYDYACLKYKMLDVGRLFDFYKALPENKIISTHSLAKYLSIPCELNLKSLASHLDLDDFSHHDVVDDTNTCKNIFIKLHPQVDEDKFHLWDKHKIKGDHGHGKIKRTKRTNGWTQPLC